MNEPPDPAPKLGRFRLRGFADAFHGIGLVLRTQANARIHAAATVAVAALGLSLGLSRIEWVAIVGVVTLVWVAEALNTAVEFTIDLVSPEYRRLAGWAKDAAAGAVLLASIGAVLVGLLVFGPKLFK
jgi:diacylglycerol kinase (ATP)